MSDHLRKKSMKSTRILLVIGVLLFCTASFSSAASCTPVVLVTGFEPFQNYTVNPSGLIAEALNGSSVAGAMVIGVVLPVEYNKSVEIAVHAIEQYQPVLVISCGLNPRAHDIHVEKIGVNLKRYQKENGRWSFLRMIDTSGPFLRISRLRTGEIVRAIRDANISAQQSYYAGMYVCNGLFYQLLGYAYGQDDSVTVGFIHVPLLSSQDPQGMPLEIMVDAVKLAIQTGLGPPFII
jgi:pyroglutamyl-peptidase